MLLFGEGLVEAVERERASGTREADERLVEDVERGGAAGTPAAPVDHRGGTVPDDPRPGPQVTGPPQ